LLVAEQTLEVGGLRWFYLEANSALAGIPIVLLHGMPAHSYAWRVVLPGLAQAGYRVIAPDWIGFGESSKPDKSEFAYSPEAFLNALGGFLDGLKIDQCILVVQGFLGSVGIQYALRFSKRIKNLVILNAPLSTAAKLPGRLKQLGWPLLGDMLTQNPLSVDNALEYGGWQIENADLAIYRAPYNSSGDAGRALMLSVRNIQLAAVTAEITAGFEPWKKPGFPFEVLVVWGAKDRYLGEVMGKTFTTTYPQVELAMIAKGGHYPQEHYPEEVNEAILRFLR
jgi:pimeloyl-ACP methyl ester carboxylesterase